MDARFQRNEMLIGTENINILKNAKVILFGVGGVGSSVAESLARAGIGAITIVDADDVDITNLNRQLLATSETVGKPKVDVMKKRILSIHPNCEVTAIKTFYLPENADKIDLSEFDYIIDAIDTVTAKIDLVVRANHLGVPIISSMGTGNKLHPELLKIADIYETKVCPLCRVMRKELKSRGIKNLKVVYSEEEPMTPSFQPEGEHKKQTPASMPFVPPVAGFFIASAVVNDLIRI